MLQLDRYYEYDYLDLLLLCLLLTIIQKNSVNKQSFRDWTKLDESRVENIHSHPKRVDKKFVDGSPHIAVNKPITLFTKG
jgi:hypothetical protein